MTRTFLLIRHGETDWNAQGRWQGQCDIPLNETGRAQARRLAQRLPRLWEQGVLPGAPQALWSSDLSRAQETALLLGLPLPLQSDVRLRERAFGAWEGKTNAELGLAPESRERAADAEAPERVWERVVAALESLWEVGAPVAVVVGHGGALRAALAHAAGLPPSGMSRFQLGNTALSVVQYAGPRWAEAHGRLVRVNDTAHLEDR